MGFYLIGPLVTLIPLGSISSCAFNHIVMMGSWAYHQQLSRCRMSSRASAQPAGRVCSHTDTAHPGSGRTAWFHWSSVTDGSPLRQQRCLLCLSNVSIDMAAKVPCVLTCISATYCARPAKATHTLLCANPVTPWCNRRTSMRLCWRRPPLAAALRPSAARPCMTD